MTQSLEPGKAAGEIGLLTLPVLPENTGASLQASRSSQSHAVLRSAKALEALRTTSLCPAFKRRARRVTLRCHDALLRR